MPSYVAPDYDFDRMTFPEIQRIYQSREQGIDVEMAHGNEEDPEVIIGPVPIHEDEQNNPLLEETMILGEENTVEGLGLGGGN